MDGRVDIGVYDGIIVWAILKPLSMSLWLTMDINHGVKLVYQKGPCRYKLGLKRTCYIIALEPMYVA